MQVVFSLKLTRMTKFSNSQRHSLMPQITFMKLHGFQFQLWSFFFTVIRILMDYYVETIQKLKQKVKCKSFKLFKFSNFGKYSGSLSVSLSFKKISSNHTKYNDEFRRFIAEILSLKILQCADPLVNVTKGYQM